ncbi:MAG: Ig-like domain-containing protein [Gemmatimonadota bacterium]
MATVREGAGMAMLLAALACGGSKATQPTNNPPVAVAKVTVTTPTASVVVRALTPFAVVLEDANGGVLAGRAVTWQSSDTTVAMVDATGSVIALADGAASISAASEGKSGSADITVTRGTLPLRGLYVQFERRGWPSGFYSGDVIRSFTDFDAVLGSTVAAEVAAQLDAIKALGVNTVTFELRATDATYDPSIEPYPMCNVSPPLGLQWPQPDAAHLENLVAFFDLTQSKGVKILLRLVNTHFEDQYRTQSATWLSAILNKVKSHAALELVLFEGDARHVDSNGDGTLDACGTPAEPPLWLGPDAVPAKYVQWAIGHAMTLGIPARKLSAQAVTGNWFIDNNGPSGSAATDSHLWHTVRVLKTVFDRLSIPDADRTYAISMYQATRCRFASGLACTDATPPAWADQTLRRVWAEIGIRSRARVIAVEMGVSEPLANGYGAEEALPSAVNLMRRHGVDGGSFWRWTHFTNDEEASVTAANAIKRRGAGYSYFPVKDSMVALYGAP